MFKKETVSFHAVFFLTAIFSMFAVLFFMFTFSARSIILSKELLSQKIEVRGAQCLDEAGLCVMEIINEKAHVAAENKYNSLLSELGSRTSESVSEKEAYKRYMDKYVSAVENSLSVELLSGALEKKYSPKKGKIILDAKNRPTFNVICDEETGNIKSLLLEDLTFIYSYGENYVQSRSYDYEIDVPYGVFFDGNDELFDYSMIGQKGIYITGKTSSVVGNIFAGTHTASEYRTAESGYGERKIYGGINIMSTQLGVEAEKVISTGEINLKGAFAVFGTEETPITIYSGDINELSGFFMSTSYTLNGTAQPRNGSDYEEAVKLIDSCRGLIDSSSYYYDSDNDDTYGGKYRKIISGTDVSITGDFTGVIITPGNVIVEADSNVEGLIYAGDRIYVQGNNNIVSNRDILRAMLAEELSNENIDPAYKMSSYFGGLKKSGLEECPDSMTRIAK